MPSIPLFGAAVSKRSLVVSAQERVNVTYEAPTPDQQDRATVPIYGRPGLSRFGYYGAQPARGMRAIEPYLYVVFGNTLYRIDNAAGATALGTLNTAAGPCTLTQNGEQLMIVPDDGTGDGYVLQISGTAPATGQVPGDGLVQIASADFLGADYVDYLQNRGLTRVPGTNPLQAQSFQQSGIGDFTGWDALAFDLADTQPDALAAVIGQQGIAYLLGQTSTEYWQFSGAQPFAYSRLPSMVKPYGVAARHSITRFGDALALLAQTQGGQAVPALLTPGGYQEIAPPDLVAEIASYADVSDARGAFVQVAGHKLYLLSFPTAGRCWVWDGTTNVWCKWESYNRVRFRGQLAVRFLKKTILADWQDGTLYTLDSAVHEDDGAPLAWRVRSRRIYDPDGQKLIVNGLQFVMNTGRGLSTGQGSDPVVQLRVSKDNGRTWGNYMTGSTGRIGKYQTRVRFQRLGSAYDFTFELSGSDPVPLAIADEELDLEKAA